jgi:hypothetical protein
VVTEQLHVGMLTARHSPKRIHLSPSFGRLGRLGFCLNVGTVAPSPLATAPRYVLPFEQNKLSEGWYGLR